MCTSASRGFPWGGGWEIPIHLEIPILGRNVHHSRHPGYPVMQVQLATLMICSTASSKVMHYGLPCQSLNEKVFGGSWGALQNT